MSIFFSFFSIPFVGHCHPRILRSLQEQASRLTLSSRAFHNDQLGIYAKYITEYFGYDMVLPMNTGAEAVETSVKLARRWGYQKKRIPENQAMILACNGNFHGRTMTAVSLSMETSSRSQFGPFLPNVGPICPKTGNFFYFFYFFEKEFKN